MAEFSEMHLTDAGLNLIAKAVKGKILKFTKGYAGSGLLSENQDVYQLENLIEPVREMGIAVLQTGTQTGMVKATLVLSNEDLSESFFLREIGLFAEDPDTGNEILYGYCTAGNRGDFIPAQDSPSPVYYRFNLNIIIDRAKNVTAIFTEDPFAVSHIEMNERFDRVIKAMKAEHDALQYQINCLANASILESLSNIKQREQVT